MIEISIAIQISSSALYKLLVDMRGKKLLKSGLEI